MEIHVQQVPEFEERAMTNSNMTSGNVGQMLVRCTFRGDRHVNLLESDLENGS